MSISLDQMQLTVSPSFMGENLSPKQVAQEFESLFLAQLLTIMQESVESSDLLEGGPGKEIYLAMMNQEMGRALAAGGGVGLSRLIEPYLSKSTVPQDIAPMPPPSTKSCAKTKAPADVSNLPISSHLGWRRDPFSGEWRYHRGVDFAAPVGTAVHSLTDGRVVFAGRQGGFGNTVIVENDEGVRTRYAHLSELGIGKGEEVSRGQKIGKVGDSGRATGPHLHLEMEQSGRLLNPFQARLNL